MTKPILFSYFNKKAKELLAKYNTSKEQRASRNLGDNREIFVNDFLKSCLPPKLKVCSGEVIDNQGVKTGQLDAVIIRDDAPSLDFGGKNTYLAEGVFGVIEVKSNLTTEKIKEAVRTFENVRNLTIPPSSIVIGGHNLGRPLRVVFAYEGATWETIEKAIKDNNAEDLFDLICILNRGVFIRKGRLLFAYDKTTGNKIERDFTLDTGASALGFFYYYLVMYGVGFMSGSLQLENYFQPLEQWGK
jgi:hypothetical protein